MHFRNTIMLSSYSTVFWSSLYNGGLLEITFTIPSSQIRITLDIGYYEKCRWRILFSLLLNKRSFRVYYWLNPKRYPKWIFWKDDQVWTWSYVLRHIWSLNIRVGNLGIKDLLGINYFLFDNMWLWSYPVGITFI